MNFNTNIKKVGAFLATSLILSGCGSDAVIDSNLTQETEETGSVGQTGVAGQRGPAGQNGATGQRGPAGQNGLSADAIALNKIKAYADNNSNPKPSVYDYAIAGVTGVTTANLDAVNAAIDAKVGTDVDTTSEVQTVVNGVNAPNDTAQEIALKKIADYADDNTNPKPTLQDYVDAGVTGVTTANLDAVNAAIDAKVGTDVDTTSEVQTVVNGVNAQNASDVVLAEIGQDDDAKASDVSIADLGKILPALTGIVAANEADYQAYIADPANAFSNPATQAEVQSMITSVNNGETPEDTSDRILAEIGQDDDAKASDVSIADLGKILPALTDIVADNEAAYQAYIADPANTFSSPATQAEVQAMLNAVNQMVTQPDYYPTLTVREGSIISGSEGTIKYDVIISEPNQYAKNSGPVIFTIVKDTRFTISLDNTEAGNDNANWTIDENAAVYLITYTGNNGDFPPLSQSKVSLISVFQIPDSSKGKFTLEANIGTGSGDVNGADDKDSDDIAFSNL